MSKAIALLAVFAATAGHSPRPPPPCVQRPPPPTPHIKVINVAGCIPSADVFNQIPVQAYGTTAAGGIAAVQNGGTGKLTLFCDGALPPEATAFDYVELEYSAPNVTPYVNPWVVSYADAELLAPDGTVTSLTFQLGICPAPAPTPAHAGSQAISLCEADGSQAFAPDAGVFAGLGVFGPTLNYSIHFQVVIPPTSPGSAPILVYRLLVHYESP